MKKSQLTQFLLTFFFGPIGLFYSSFPAAIRLIIAFIVTRAITDGDEAIFVWFVSIPVGFATTDKYNKQIHNKLMERVEQKYNGLVHATREAAAATAAPVPQSLNRR